MHALALFIPTQHCIGRTAALEAGEGGFGMGCPIAEDDCGLVHHILKNIIYEWLKTHHLKLYKYILAVAVVLPPTTRQSFLFYF
jgi:hypothetical protein